MTHPYSPPMIAAVLEFGGVEVDELVASTHTDEIRRLALLNERIAALGLTNPIPEAKPWETE